MTRVRWLLTSSASFSVVAEVTRSLFNVARQYRESFDAYGSKKSFEWQQVEGEEPVIHTKSTTAQPLSDAGETVKRTAVLFLVVLPAFVGAGIAYLSRASLQWWELALYPLAGPLATCAVVVLGYMAASPSGIPDILGLAHRHLVRGTKHLWRLLAAHNRGNS